MQCVKRQSITGSLISFSIPLILSAVLQQLYAWADAFIVGNFVGEVALASVGSTTSVVNLFITVITGFTLGLSIISAKRYGEGNTGEVRAILSTFSLLLGAVFLFLAFLGFSLSHGILSFMDTAPEAIDGANGYLRIIFIGIPFLAVYNAYSASLRSIGDSRAPFYAVLISSILNVVLDIIFVAFFNTGIAGAAWATVISQAAMTFFIIIYTVRKHSELRFSLNSHAFDRMALRDGCRFGFPPMIQSSVTAAGSLILQSFMNSFGLATVTAITTAYRIDTIIMVPIINLGSAISTFTAQAEGRKDRNHAIKVYHSGLLLMLAVSFILTALVIPTGGSLIRLFGAGDEAVSIGDGFFRRIALFYFVFGLSMAVRGYVEGLGDVVYSSFAGIFSLAVRIALSYAMKPFFGNMTIAYAEMAAWLFMLLLYYLRVVAKGYNRQKQDALYL